ncbi:MAG: hypothetical protein [Circoviridae sp.]|nr:MAG: hypothetical protein [Circoviridae sp.]
MELDCKISLKNIPNNLSSITLVSRNSSPKPPSKETGKRKSLSSMAQQEQAKRKKHLTNTRKHIGNPKTTTKQSGLIPTPVKRSSSSMNFMDGSHSPPCSDY